MTRETAKKTAVAAEDFERLKQFLMKPSTDGDAAQEAKALVTTMMDHHVYADMSGQEAAVMSMVADALADAAFVVDVYKCLRRACVPPSPMTLELTAEACAHAADWQTAHDVVDQMHEAVDYMHPSIDVFEHAVRACNAAGKWMQAKQMLEQVKVYRLEASPAIHVQVIESCVLSEELTATQRVLEAFLREHSLLEPREVHDMLEGLLQLAIDHQVLDHAVFFRDQLVARDAVVSTETYEQLIQLSACQGKWHRARVLLAQLTQATSFPGAAPSNQFTRDTQQLLDDLHAHGLQIPLRVYNAALRAYGGQTRLDKAAILMEAMKQRGVEPDTVSYAAAICSCGANVDASQKYFDEFRARSLPASMDVFHTYLLAASRAKQWETVLDRYKLVQRLATDEERTQMTRDSRLQSCVAVAHGQLEHDDAMLQVFTTMKVHGLVPNLYVYAEAMHAYVRKGQWRHALMLFDHMWSEGIDKHKLAQFPLTWDAAVDAALAGDDRERLDTLYQQIVTQYGRLRPHTAAKLIEAMHAVPTETLWCDFVALRYLFDRRNIQDDSQRSWHVVNAVLRRAVIEQDAKLAERVVRDAETSLGIHRFSPATYSLMLSLHVRLKHHDDVVSWCTKMARARSRVNVHALRALTAHLHTVRKKPQADLAAFARAMAQVFACDDQFEDGEDVKQKMATASSAVTLGRHVLDVWKTRGHPMDLHSLTEYMNVCATEAELVDVFTRAQDALFLDDVVLSPEFVHALIAAMSDLPTVENLLPKLHKLVADCLAFTPSENAQAVLGAFCALAETPEKLTLLQYVVNERGHDVEIGDDHLVVLLASCTSADDEEEDKEDAGFGRDQLAVNTAELLAVCTMVENEQLHLGAGSVTFLLRALVSLLRRPQDARTQETTQVIKRLVLEVLDGSSEWELLEFIAEITDDPLDMQRIEQCLGLALEED